MAEEIISVYSLDTDKFKQKLREVEEGLVIIDGKVVKATKNTTDGFDKASESVKKTDTHTKELGKNTDALSGKLKQLGGFMVAAFSVGALIGFGNKVLDITAKFQKFEAVLTNTLGSKSAAQKALKDIQDFASKTPFSVEELTASFVKLANQGFKPTSEEMRKLGDLAASQGKSFDQLAEGILDAQTGEFERLKEFGIRAEKAGDKVKFTFKGVQTQTDFTAASIQKYVLGLGDLAGVSGGMAAISKTLGGQISNLGDNFDALLVTIGNAGSGFFSSFLSGMNDLIGGLNNLLIPASEAAVNAFDKQRESVLNLQDNIVPLADRYDVLAGKTTLTTAEQAEMKKIIEQISSVMPGAVSAQDKYGNAIALNTGRVKEFVKEEKARLRITQKDAIEEQEKSLKLVQEKLKQSQDVIAQINKTGSFKQISATYGASGLIQTVTEVKDQALIKQAFETNASLLDQQLGLNAELKRLRGDDLDNLKEVKKKEVVVAATVRVETAAELKKRLSDQEAYADALNKIEEKTNKAIEASMNEAIKTNDDAAKEKADALKEIETESQARQNRELGYQADYLKTKSEKEKKALEETEKLEKEAHEKRIERANQIAQVTTALVGLMLQASRQETDEKIANIDTQTQKDLDANQAQLDNKTITQKQFEANKLSLEKNAQSQRSKLLTEQAQQEKNFALFQATLKLGLAIIEAFLPPFNIAAPIVAGIELAAIAAAPLPKFAKGTSYLQLGNNKPGVDTIPILANKGERIVPTEQNRKHWDIYEAIDKGGFEKYVAQQFIYPALKAQAKEYEKQKSESFADQIASSFILNQKGLNDGNIVEGLKMTRKQARENALFIADAVNRNRTNARHR